MYTAYRLNDPHEVMPPHRHSPSAIRFGLTGKGNFTGVDGEDITFGPGDMVLTPNDTWHNHGNVGDEPAINLSVLDLPLVETLNAIHFDHDYTEMVDGKPVKRKEQTATCPTDYSARIYGDGGLMPRFVKHDRGSAASSPMYVYRWDMMRELLERHKDWDGDPHEALMVEYVDPLTGGPVFKTITFFVQMLRPGEKTLPLRADREPAGRAVRGPRLFDRRRQALRLDGVRHARGAGRRLVRACQRLGQASRLFLFVASDEPALQAFALFKKWGREGTATSCAWSDPVAASVNTTDGISPDGRCDEHQAGLPYRLSRRRPGLGRRHHALCRPHAPAERHVDLRHRRSEDIRSCSRMCRCAGGLAFAQGARRRTA